MGPLGTGRYASGTPSARVEGALADGTDPLCSGLHCALAPPCLARGSPPPAPLPGSTTT